MTSAATLEWDDSHLVGHHGMDLSHRQFALCLNAVLAAEDKQLTGALALLLQHLEVHFAFEEALMEQHAFPARGCHADEHGRVLASMRQTLTEVQAGDTAVARELAQALLDWFVGHADYMDSALATWVAKKTLQGAPVVVRRAMRHTMPVPP